MKYLKLLLIIVTGILMPTLSWASLNGVARISLIEGDAQIRHEDSSEWYPASVNTPLCEGDSIWSPDGARVEVQFQNGSFVRLDETSSLDILALRDDLIQIHLGMGRAYVRTAAMEDQALQMDLNASSVQAYDKARIRIDLSRDGDEDISLLKGAAYVESNGRRTRVRAGEMFSMEEGSAEILPLNPPDEWDRWNTGRDGKFFARRTGPGYLPGELVAYESDLNNNGEWRYVREYGYVWRPTVIPGPDWSPYQVGRWVWVGGDYVWISHESWGWAPYHYGRWVSIPSVGWCWVPPARGDVFWAPGYVGWVSTPRYVGWVPLAPGETYYGRGYYGRKSVDITRVNVRNVTVNEVVYKNVTVNNALTVVNRNSFASGNGSYVKPRENVFLKKDVHLGRPDIKPARTAMMPVVKTVSLAKLPPPAIRNVPFQELRERHPRIKGTLTAAREESRGMPTDKQPVRQTTPQAQKAARPETVGAPPETHRYEGKQGRPSTPQIQKGTRPETVIAPPGTHREAAKLQRPASRPEVIEYPGGKLTGGERQKASAPESRPWHEIKKSVPDAKPDSKPDMKPDMKPVSQTYGRNNEREKGSRPVLGGTTESGSPKDRQKERPPVPVAMPVKKPADQNQAKVPGNVKNPERPDFPKRGAEQRPAVPPETRKPDMKAAVPAVTQRAANPVAAPQQKADRKVWKMRIPENATGEAKKEKKEKKAPEKEHDKPVRTPGQQIN